MNLDTQQLEDQEMRIKYHVQDIGLKKQNNKTINRNNNKNPKSRSRVQEANIIYKKQNNLQI